MSSQTTQHAPIAGRGTQMGPPDYVASLPTDKITAIRAWVRQASTQGYSPDEINAALKPKYNITAAQVMKTTPDDAIRSGLQGATFGHADELYGLASKLGGGSYTSARDAVRANDAQYASAHPVANFGMQLAGGAIPAALTAGLSTGATVSGTAARGAGLGALAGGLQGEGSSNATTVGGMAKDAAVGAAVGGAFGGAVGGVAGKLANVRRGPQVVAREVASQLPNDPVEAVGAMARQHQLAPETVVLADAAPETRRMLASIGVDRKTAMVAKADAFKRVQQLDDALKEVGTYYNKLNGQMKPVDRTLRSALNTAELTKDYLRPGQRAVDLGKIREASGNLKRMARSTADGAKSFKLNRAAEELDTWIEGHAPSIREVNSNYRFLLGRKDAAEETLQAITESSKNYAANRATGFESGSLGGSLPTTRHGVVGTVTNFLTKPDRAGRAKAIAQLLLTPQRDATGFQTLHTLRQGLLNPESLGIPGLANVIVTSDLVPKASAALLSPP